MVHVVTGHEANSSVPPQAIRIHSDVRGLHSGDLATLHMNPIQFISQALFSGCLKVVIDDKSIYSGETGRRDMNITSRGRQQSDIY